MLMWVGVAQTVILGIGYFRAGLALEGRLGDGRLGMTQTLAGAASAQLRSDTLDYYLSY